MTSGVYGLGSPNLWTTVGGFKLDHRTPMESSRGFWWNEATPDVNYRLHAGLLLFGKQPDAVFPQVRIAANAYGGTERGEAIDRDDIREALPRAVERAFQFLKRNMRHTTRIEGFSKVEIDEYPYEALREAVVNAVAHRDYDLAGSCIRIKKFANRIEILSPGLPPEPITLESIGAVRLAHSPQGATG
jgi:ATP-dependent DNA helicase RecG